jgi:hypothetical protein
MVANQEAKRLEYGRDVLKRPLVDNHCLRLESQLGRQAKQILLGQLQGRLFFIENLGCTFN